MASGKSSHELLRAIRDEGTLATGDVLWMTAGSDVIHNEEVVPNGPTRILQLWLTLPHAQRWAAPRFEHVVASTLPVRREDGVVARVYSGVPGSAKAATYNHVPVTLVDITLSASATFAQDVPASYNGFLYVVDGDVRVGPDGTALATCRVAWLASLSGDAVEGTTLRITGGHAGARVLLYAGERTNTPIVMHGAFVGETRDDLVRVSRQFTEGKIPRASELR